jgi:hypothetical protein
MKVGAFSKNCPSVDIKHALDVEEVPLAVSTEIQSYIATRCSESADSGGGFGIWMGYNAVLEMCDISRSLGL